MIVNNNKKRNKGICEKTFTEHHTNYKKSFNSIKSNNDNSLSIEFWTIKQKQRALTLTYEIIEHYKANKPTLKKCNLCFDKNFSDYRSPKQKLAEQEVRRNLSMPASKQI